MAGDEDTDMLSKEERDQRDKEEREREEAEQAGEQLAHLISGIISHLLFQLCRINGRRSWANLTSQYLFPKAHGEKT